MADPDCGFHCHDLPFNHFFGCTLPKLSAQKINDHIKECCEEAGIKNLVNYVDYSGGKAREHSEPKYKLITNHTARKTFISNSIMLGMNTKTIKEITGHKKDSVFNKYVKISEEFKKLEIPNNNLPPLPPDREAIVLKEAKASSEIENIVTKQDSLYQALTAKAYKPDLATKEVLRYREALFAGADFVRKIYFLSINGIIQIQHILEENDAGFRNMPGTVLKNGASGKVVYTPPDDKVVIEKLMANFEQYINNTETDDVSLLIKLAVLHFQFERIHPFYDGNGRTGRIINVLFLMLKGHLYNPILYLSGFIIRNKGEYYRLLEDVNFKNKWEPWILYILKGIEETALETIAQMKNINSLMLYTIKKVKEEAPLVYTKEFIELLFEHP